MIIYSDKGPKDQPKEFYENLIKTGLNNETNAVSVICAEDGMIPTEASKFSFRTADTNCNIYHY
jgi:hypothetical protein